MNGLKIMGVAAALLTSTSVLAQSNSWVLSEASGRVVVRDGQGERAGQRGSRVPAGATLLTGNGARAVLVRGEDFVTVAADSRLRVPTAEQATGLFQMIQEWGNAVFRIKHLPKPHFAVQTPYLAAVVKGTTFSVAVNGDGTSLQVIDGAVEVATTDGGAHELIRPGVVATITAADRYRLQVQGQNAHAVDSPQRAEGAAASSTGSGGVAPSEAGNGAAGRSSAAAGDDDIAWSEVSTSVIAAPIEAKPVDLATVTGGLVTGQAGAHLAAANVARNAGGAVEVASHRSKAVPSETPAVAGSAPVAANGADATPTTGSPNKRDKSNKGNKGQGDDKGDARDTEEPASQPGKDDPAEAAPKPGKDDPADKAPKPDRDNPADKAPKPDRDDPAEKAPKPGKDDPADKAPKPGKDDPSDKAPKPGKDDPGDKAPKPDKDDPGDKAPKPGKDDPRDKAPKPGKD